MIKKIDHIKSATSLLIMIIFCIILLNPLLPIIDYSINYNYISNQICVNKNQPELECHGKCYLTKAFKKTQELNQINLKKVHLKIEVVPFFLISKFLFIFHERLVEKIKHSFYYSIFFKSVKLTSIKPPPKFC